MRPVYRGVNLGLSSAVTTVHSQFRSDPPPVEHLIDSAARSSLARVILQTDGPGVIEVPGLSNPLVAIHVGRPVHLACRRGGESHDGLAVHGDVDLVPAGVFGRWEVKARDTALLVSLSTSALTQAAESFGAAPGTITVRNRFQIRDPQIEHIGWALRAEAEAGYPNGQLYLDSLATALAVHVVRRHSVYPNPAMMKVYLSPRVLKSVIAYIDNRLEQNISLPALATIAGVGPSHFKVLFRKAMGVPVHQYVIRRRVERAASLLEKPELSISQIALEVGFSHQSHLSLHMRRVLGVSPKQLRRQLT
jgi:AraC family transcriptional regulator